MTARTFTDDAQALAWYRAVYDDDQTTDDLVLARLDAWKLGQVPRPGRARRAAPPAR